MFIEAKGNCLDRGLIPLSSTHSKRSLIVKVRQTSACNNDVCKPYKGLIDFDSR